MNLDPMPRLIPRHILFGNPDRTMARLSPDGARIGYLAPSDGVLNVWVGPADDPSRAKPVTQDTHRGIRWFSWAYTNRHILYIQDRGGDENWRLYSVDLAAGETRDLTPLEGVQAQVQKISHRHPAEVLVGLNDRDPQYHDLYRIAIANGERQLVQRNEGFVGFVADEDYRPRLAQRMTARGGVELFSPGPDGAWEPFLSIDMEDALTTSALGFDQAGRTLYMLDSRGRNTGAMIALDYATRDERLLAENPRADAGDVMIHPTERNVQAVAFTYERKEWQVLDEAVAADLAYLRTVADGDVEVVSRTLDDDRWIVAYVMDDGPVRYYRYDRARQHAEFLFTNRQELEGLPLAKMRPAVIPARDGLDLVSYYTLPVGSEQDGGDRPRQPLPLVLLVHGGPWARDAWGFDPWHQWLANRGYAVLSVNYRGSTGFGKAFVNAGDHEWGARMHDDLLDAVRWAVEQRIADPERVAIMGGSFGGYATLVGLTFTPQTFAVGVDIVGPSNLLTLLESIPPYWKPQFEMFATRVGDPRTEKGREFLISRSPLTHAGRIRRPLLIGQGANDPRVKQAESDQIVEAVQEKHIPVTYVLYPDEGHGFARPENSLSFNAVAEAFLAENLGGRFEPVGDDFHGSSITVLAGAGRVPGLADALERTGRAD